MTAGPGVVGQVSGLWRYPASSLAGERMASIDVAGQGAAGDRLFGLVDTQTGQIAKPDGEARWHGVARIATRLDDRGGLHVAVPGGEWLSAPGLEADRAISDHLGFAAAVRPLAGEAASGGLGALAVARYIKAPIHLLTTASLARLKALHPQGDPDPRRFRPNIVVDMPAVEGHFPETEWIGRRLQIGEVELTIQEPCRRCGFTIIAQDGLENDPEILRNLLRHNTKNLGVYCSVDRPGSVGEGDEVRLG